MWTQESEYPHRLFLQIGVVGDGVGVGGGVGGGGVGVAAVVVKK